MRFDSHYALAELPYFELRDGRIAVSDPEWERAIDVHTHLSLAYLRRTPLDLFAEHERTQHYLPLERPLDLDVYINRNFTPADLSALRRDLGARAMTARGMRVTHTVANLRREMAELQITRSVLLPIDWPVLSWNADSYLAAAARSDAVVSLGSIHPLARNIRRKLTAQKAAGARGIKLHPMAQLTAPDSDRAMAVYRVCADLELPVFFHCGPVGIEPAIGRRLCQLERYRRPVVDNPDCTFVLGHSGALQMEQALELARRHDNVYLELASQSLTNVRHLLRHGPTDRIMFGTDWPFYHQATGLAKVLLATEHDPELRRRVLWDTAARLFGIDD